MSALRVRVLPGVRPDIRMSGLFRSGQRLSEGPLRQVRHGVPIAAILGCPQRHPGEDLGRSHHLHREHPERGPGNGLREEVSITLGHPLMGDDVRHPFSSMGPREPRSRILPSPDELPAGDTSRDQPSLYLDGGTDISNTAPSSEWTHDTLISDAATMLSTRNIPNFPLSTWSKTPISISGDMPLPLSE